MEAPKPYQLNPLVLNLIAMNTQMADVIDEHGNPIQLTDEHGNPVTLTDEHGNPMHLIGVATSPRKKDSVLGSGMSTTGTGTHDIAHGTSATSGALGSGLPSYAHHGTAPGSRTGPTGSYDASYPSSETGGAPGTGLPTHTGQTAYGTVPVSGIQDVTPSGIMAGQGMCVAAPTTTRQYPDYGQQQMERPAEIHHSTTSSDSSSEDDGQGGRRKKKSLTQKIKEKITGKHDESEGNLQSLSVSTTTTTTKTTVTATAEAPPVGQRHDDVGHHEKKSFMEKIKQKLPGHHSH